MTDPTPPMSARALDRAAIARIRARLAALPEAPWLHQESARRLAERLVVIRQPPRRVLDSTGSAGAPPGVLAGACPGARIDRVDARAGVGLEPAPGAWWRRWRPAPSSAPDGGYDMVWSVMDLHWSVDPPATMRDWRQALAPDGFLMFSTLGPGSLARLRALYQEAGWGSPMAPLVDMHDLGDMLVEAGFADPVMDQEQVTLTWSSPAAALAELRTLGANADPARRTGCSTPRWRERLLEALQAQAAADGRVALTFELVYGHAYRAPEAGPRVSPNTAIGLNEMKLMLRKSGRR